MERNGEWVSDPSKWTMAPPEIPAGLTVQQWFAGQALAGLLAGGKAGQVWAQPLDDYAHDAWLVSGMMMFWFSKTKGRRVESGGDGVADPSVKSLGLPTRVYLALCRCGINTVDDLTASTGKWLGSQKDIGETSLREIRTVLAQAGLRLAGDPPF